MCFLLPSTDNLHFVSITEGKLSILNGLFGSGLPNPTPLAHLPPQTPHRLRLREVPLSHRASHRRFSVSPHTNDTAAEAASEDGEVEMRPSPPVIGKNDRRVLYHFPEK
uniref:Uncharacterized protein n=1 Tax=Nelumbo nucifera TaxID=4432 RepID=A0A822XU55_NELNU|nr:TPA_asm: hypothetical protein HUJ06_024736 [Nelumbo nucifera]